MTVAWLVVLLLVAVLAVSFAVRSREVQRAPVLLRQLAVLLTAAVAVAVFPAFWADSGAHALWALGLLWLPAALAEAAAAVTHRRVGVP